MYISIACLPMLESLQRASFQPLTISSSRYEIGTPIECNFYFRQLCPIECKSRVILPSNHLRPIIFPQEYPDPVPRACQYGTQGRSTPTIANQALRDQNACRNRYMPCWECITSTVIRRVDQNSAVIILQ